MISLCLTIFLVVMMGASDDVSLFWSCDDVSVVLPNGDAAKNVYDVIIKKMRLNVIRVTLI